MKKKLVLRIAALTMALGAAQAVHAADGRKVEVPAGDLISALKALSSQADVEFVYEAGQLQGLQTNGASGELSAEEAVARLLEGTNLQVAGHRSGAIVISTSPPAVIEAAAPPADDPGGQASATSPDVTELDKVMVTGSRLQQMGADSVIPVKQLDQRELIEAGQMDLVETLRDVPGVGGNDSLTGNQGSIQGNGLSTISLRGLGLARTLVLIDGRRTVSNAGNRNVVSLSTIPQYMIGRVDVTTGGASAVYGSDAIAGVVNIITPERMDGFKVRLVERATQDGGGGSTEFSIGAGSRFFDDRLYVMGAVTYDEQRPLYARDRDWALRSASYSANSNRLTTPHMTSFNPGGRFAGDLFYYDEEGLQEGFVTSVNGWDVRQEGFLITPREMINAGGKLMFDINDDLQFFGHVMYSAVDTEMEFEPVYAGWGTTYGVNDEFQLGRIPRDNPFAPAEIVARVGSAGITWTRRFNELGNRGFDNHRVTWRGTAGFRGTLFDGAWDWDATYGFGDFDGHQVSKNYLNMRNMSHALDAATVDGAVVCADPVARTEGCVPLNLFGVGSISPEAADYIRSDKQFWARNRQHTFEASITGSPFSMPAGPAQTAFGVEWRRDETSSRTDDLTQEGMSSGPFIPDFTGEITARSAYAEARLPLLRDLPLARDLSVELAFRVSDYPDLANVGTTFSYRGGVQWTLVDRLMFRTAYGLAQRAPYTTELYSPPRDGYSNVSDVCHDITAATPGIAADNCRLDPGIAAVIARDGRFIQDNTRVFTPASGNIDLKEETAHTLTAGFIFAPWKGMEASIDYYDIKIEDAITSISNPSLLSECYFHPDGIDNEFCAPIRRDAEGQIIRIDNQQLNLNSMRASGIDVAFNQRFDLNRLGVPGQFTLDGSYTHRTRLETIFEGATGPTTTDFNGAVGTFRNEARVGLAWSNSPVRVKWTTIYKDEAVDSNARKDLFESLGTTDPLFLHVPSFVRHDLNISISPIRTGNVSWRVFGNIINVFDRHSPFLPSGTDSGGTYNYNGTYGVSGRTFSLGVEIRL
ncbi:TonB-dependent receptor domain-containing protein [Luteimonas sp. R10]|uniref:TonB-dependent receptor domain-containing protein n=1 Tax=Luteimonas sp. R10 TaxID=3108176 RepID=UPI0030913750|nr:TonB-dependent receptor [Luteimonas sp. R10]